MKKYLACLLLLFASCKPSAERFNGYVEGEFVMIAPTTSGILETLSVERGQQVGQGDALFSLDLITLRAERDAAQADVAKAEATWSDLTKGKRSEEIEVILKQKEQAQAMLTSARQEYERVEALVKKGAASTALLERTRADLDAAKARLGELVATLESSTLGAREDQLKAAQAQSDIAKQKLNQAEKRLAEAAPVAAQAVRVEDTFFRPGEYVMAGTPVVSLLPPENVKIRFFVPQAEIPKIRYGQAVSIQCDGCASAIAAKVSFIADKAEYTPPVIYSVESRDKLVFLVEATPSAEGLELKPGLPVDVTVE